MVHVSQYRPILYVSKEEERKWVDNDLNGQQICYFFDISTLRFSAFNATVLSILVSSMVSATL